LSYWDTSALLKLYVPEPDSPTFLDLLTRARKPLVSAAIANTEMLCALYRKEHVGDLHPGAADLLYQHFRSDVVAGRIILVPDGSDVRVEAEKLVARAYSQGSLFIRSLDALHVASALAVKATTFVATDARLGDAAVLMGLKVVPQPR
jgi:predicted nucleic acid-binding protein